MIFTTSSLAFSSPPFFLDGNTCQSAHVHVQIYKNGLLLTFICVHISLSFMGKEGQVGNDLVYLLFNILCQVTN